MQDKKSNEPQDSQTDQPADKSFDSDDTFRKNIVFLSFFGTSVIYFLCWVALNGYPETSWQVFITGTLTYLIFLAMSVQSRIYKQQSRAMTVQAATALRQYELTDRPWLTADVTIDSPLTFTDEGGLRLSFQFSALNVGRSVAVKATIHAAMIMPRFDQMFDIVLAEQARVCAHAHSKFMAYTVFPNRAYVQKISFPQSPEQVQKGRLEGLGSEFIQIYIVGCVDYQFSGHEAHHQTRFVYQVMRRMPEYPDRGMGLMFGQDLPLNQLLLQTTIMGGCDYAD